VRPLDPLSSIKVKLGVIILAAVAMTAIVQGLGLLAGLPLFLVVAASGALALLVVQVLARGMTSPLREMAAAARSMSRGDYSKRVTASSRDEVGELARAFNSMAGELAEVDRMRRDLIANVSHELRTPIGALQAVLENLIDGVAAPDPATLRTMLDQVERLGALVAQLLDLSRLESGAIPLDVQRFDVKQLLDKAAAEAMLHSPKVEMEVAVAPNGLQISADPERVRQVVANLLDNAVRHSPPGGVVSLEAKADTNRITIAVNDEGPGIPADEVSRVFERFYRSDASRSSQDGGSGLGLAIARWIVDLHGGDIRAESREPKGCRMVVELPSEMASSLGS
jgi:signal transduction histidine kinase